MPAGHFRLLPLYDALNSILSWKPTVVMQLSNAAYRSLVHFWTKLKVPDCRVDWDPLSPDELLFTDSSDFGLGVHTAEVCSNMVVSGLWPA